MEDQKTYIKKGGMQKDQELSIECGKSLGIVGVYV